MSTEEVRDLSFVIGWMVIALGTFFCEKIGSQKGRSIVERELACIYAVLVGIAFLVSAR